MAATTKYLVWFHNVWTDKYFAISMGGIMIIVIIIHWIHVTWLKYGRKSLLGAKLATIMPAGYFRRIHQFLDTDIFTQKIGHWILYFIYWIINLVLLLTNVDLGSHKYVGKRLGWICLANLTLLVFLALRNTPLAPLSGRSYEQLRPLHKTAGYTCILAAVLHSSVYLTAWSKAGILEYMQLPSNFSGGIAGLSMVIIGLSTVSWIRRNLYEVFYVIHVIFFVLILITVGLHRPEIKLSALAIVISIACLWVTDRLLRFLKLCWYFPGNRARLMVLPNDTVRVTLSRSIRCSPGSHAYLWIPGIRLMESHPFTLVSEDPIEFVVRVHDGFTHDLYTKAAESHPDTASASLLRCSVDGGYGQVMDFMEFDHIFFIAGGSGASFTFPVALDVVKKCSKSNVTKMIEFIWVVSRSASFTWYEKELSQLQNSPNVRIFLYVTQEVDDEPMIRAKPKEITRTTPTGLWTDESVDNIPTAEIEKRPATPRTAEFPITLLAPYVRKGRPDIQSHLAPCAKSYTSTDRIGIGACGPDGMIKCTRAALVQSTYSDGPSITLHSEVFGW